MQSPQQTHQDHDTRSMPSWYQKFRMGPLGPLGLCAIAMGFIALLISGRLRMLYPMPRTVVASPQTEEPGRPLPPTAANTGGGKPRLDHTAGKPTPSASPRPAPHPTSSPAATSPRSGEFETPSPR